MDKAALALIGQAEICLFIVQSFLLRPCGDSDSGQVLAHAQTCPGARNLAARRDHRLSEPALKCLDSD